ncbi:MAG: DUF4340 domain-containing protein [bacterium]
MSWKPTWWLLVIVILTGVFVGVFERGAKPSARSMPVDTPLLQFNRATVTRLSISADGVTVVCNRRDGQWFLTKPFEMRADSARVNRLVETLAAIRQQEVINSERREKRNLTLANFGLEVPRARITIGSESHADEILMGDPSPLGNTVYVLVNGDTRVIAVTCRVSDILPLDLDGLQDRNVFPVSIKQAVRVEVKRAEGFFQLALRNGVWRIQQPFDALADSGRVEHVLQSLSLLVIEGFGNASAGVAPATYGFGADESVLQVSVWPVGRSEPLVLTVGKIWPDNPAWVAAKVSDTGRIFAIRKDSVPFLNLKPESLRDRRICDADPSLITTISLREGDNKLMMKKGPEGGWLIVEPVRFSANTRAVGALLRTLCTLQGEEVIMPGETNQIPAEIETLSAHLTIATASAVKLASNETAGLTVPGGVWSYSLGTTGSVVSGSLAFREETRSLFRVNEDDLMRLWAVQSGRARHGLTDPLQYMECRMLDLNPQHIRKITLSRQGREETVTVSADGDWVVESPPDGQLKEGAVPALMEWASNLQAQYVESIAVTNAATYGLDESSERLTFGLSGGGIQKTLLIGHDNGQNGVYAMVQGQDVIFVLQKLAADSLMRSLVKGH